MFKTMDNESGAYYQLNTKTDTYNHKNYLYKPSRNSVWEDQYLVENLMREMQENYYLVLFMFAR